MKNTNLKTMMEQQPRVRASDAEIEAQKNATARRNRGFWTRTLLNLTVLCVGSALTAYGQSTDPWSTTAGQLAAAFTGPIAKGFSLVAIVVGGLELAYGNGSHRHMGGLLFGVGIAISAPIFLAWITG